MKVTKAADLARWLAKHVTAIAADPGAAICFREIHEAIGDIQRMTDRPRSPLFVGRCPTMLTAGSYGQQRCTAELVIPPDAKRVQCRACHASFEVGELVEHRIDELAPDVLFTAAEVLVIMDLIRTPIPESTWRRWRALGHVQPAGELYGEPAYRIQDVREFRRKWTRRKAG